jgi:hypothetical protein
MPRLTHPEMDAIERACGHKLPELYRSLLANVGYGPVGTAAEIYHPLAIKELYEPFFDKPAQLFDLYFPFGCQNVTQEIWVIDVSREVAASLWHETVPEDWDGEEWLPYDLWRVTYLEPERNATA